MDENPPPVAESAAPAPSSWRARWNAFRETKAYGYLKPWPLSWLLGGVLAIYAIYQPGVNWLSGGTSGFIGGFVLGWLADRIIILAGLESGAVNDPIRPKYGKLVTFGREAGQASLEIAGGLIEFALEFVGGLLVLIVALVLLVALIKFIWTALP